MKTWWLVLMSRSSSDSATTGLGNSGYQSTGDRLAVRISGCPAAARSLVSSYRSSAWLGGELAHGEVVEDEDVWAGELAEAGVPAAVGVAACQVRQGPAGLGEADVGAGPDGEVAQGLGDVAFPDADRAVEDH